MKIGLIGAGAMSTALGETWKSLGHELFVGSSDPDKARELATTLGVPERAGTYLEAARFADAVLFAIRWEGVADVAKELATDPSALAGKVIIDCTNPVEVEQFTTVAGATSMGESIQATLPYARVVKAFNLAHAEVWRSPSLSVAGGPVQVPICGDDPHARTMVAELVAEMHMRGIDMGPLKQARNMEGAAALIIQLLFSGWDTTTVFQFVTATPSDADTGREGVVGGANRAPTLSEGRSDRRS